MGCKQPSIRNIHDESDILAKTSGQGLSLISQHQIGMGRQYAEPGQQPELVGNVL